MSALRLPRYPIYVPSKSRVDACLTAKYLRADGVPFRLVVEPQEYDAYARRFGADQVLELPFQDAGSVTPARNWIKDHATATGHERHWQLDDNIGWIGRRWKTRRIPCNAGVALAVAEDFAERYTNVGLLGLNYEMFLPSLQAHPPFVLNCRVYSCTLALNALPYRWRGIYNEDADLCLQVLAGGWCTVLLNVFYVWKKWTMQMRGGNTDALYQGDGRLKMARSLERLWPGVVTVDRRFRRPQHVVKNSWRRFDTPLKLKPGIALAALPPNEYGMELAQVKPVRSPELRALLAGATNG